MQNKKLSVWASPIDIEVHNFIIYKIGPKLSLNFVLHCVCSVQNAYNSEPSYGSHHHAALFDYIGLAERN